MQIKEIFNDTSFEDNSLVYNPLAKPVKTNNSDLPQLITEIEHVDPNYKTFTDNLTKEERASITELRENGNIILMKSDKGGEWVIMDKEYYINHIVLDGRLNNPIYKPIPSNADQKVVQNLRKLVDKYSSNLTKKKKEYDLNNTWKTSEFYCTIKIHKCKSIQEAISQNDNDIIINVLTPNDLKGRPIAAGPNSPTQAFSSLIERTLEFSLSFPIVPCLTTYVKDDWHFIKQLPTTLNYEATLYSRDIESLYTSIPIDLGLGAISFWLSNKSNLILNNFQTILY